MEELIRKIVREEISRALQAVEQVADNAGRSTEDEASIAAADVVRRTVHRVAADVLADVHPVLDTGHTRVHTVTSVPERRAQSEHTCSCGHDDYRHRGGACFACECPGKHVSTPVSDYNRTCAVCEHGEHDPGKCGMHVYRRGVPCPCPCLASRTLGTQAEHNPGCGHSVCDGWSTCRSTDRPADESAYEQASTPDLTDAMDAHAGHVIQRGRCLTCTAESSTPTEPACTKCEHVPHRGTCGSHIKVDGLPFTCACGGPR